MCDICVSQYRLMAIEFNGAMEEYQKDRAEGTVRSGLEQRVHDLAMTFKMEHPVFIAWLAAVGFEYLAALKEQGMDINVNT